MPDPLLLSRSPSPRILDTLLLLDLSPSLTLDTLLLSSLSPLSTPVLLPPRAIATLPLPLPKPDPGPESVRLILPSLSSVPFLGNLGLDALLEPDSLLLAC
jgi:hypothetical protein